MFYRELTSQEDKSPITVGRAITRVVAVILSLSFTMSRPALNTLGTTAIHDGKFQELSVMHIGRAEELECFVTQPRAQSIQLSAISIAGRFFAEVKFTCAVGVLSVEPEFFREKLHSLSTV